MADKPAEPLLEQAAAATQPGEALDVACGIGRHTLWLAQRGWRVTAVDHSTVALKLLGEKATGLPVRIVRANLEHDGFDIEPDRYRLIVDTCFLYRPLLPAMKRGLCEGGVFFGVFPLEGDNLAFLMAAGELRTQFDDWEVLHYDESRPGDGRRLRAQIIARKPARRILSS